MIYVAKAINCASGRTVIFDSGEVSLATGGWSMSANFSSPENIVPGVFDDTYCYKEASNMTLNFGITCSTPEQARNKTEEILAVFSSKAQVYLFDDRYIYVYPKGSSGKYADSDTRYVDLTLNLTAEPYFLRDVTNEYIVTPLNYPTRVELENPDSRISLQFGNYNALTGVKLSDGTGWSTSASVTGYSGSGYLVTTVIGDGITFSCIGSFSLRLYMVIERKVRFFEGSTLLLERTFTNGSAQWGNIEYVFGDTKLHTITIVHAEGAGLAIDCIDLCPTSIQSIPNGGTADSYPMIELTPVETTVRYSSLGKIVGDVTHPFVSRYGELTNVNEVNPTNITIESGQQGYDLLKFCDTSVASILASGSNKYSYRLFEYNLKASKSGIPSSWTVSDILNALCSITGRIYAYGEGANGMVKDYGIEVYLWRKSTNSWESKVEKTTNTPSLISHYIGQYFSAYITDDGKLYFLVKSKYPSNGTITSAVHIDYCDLEVNYNMVKMDTDIVVNRAKNLLPPFSEWALHANSRVVDDYSLEHVCTTVPQLSGVEVPALPMKDYYFSGQEGKYMVQYYDSSGGVIALQGSPVSGTVITNRAIKTPARTAKIRINTYSDVLGAVLTFCNPVLTQSHAIQPFTPQEKYLVSLNQSQSLSIGKTLSLQSQNDMLTANGVNLIPYAGTEYLSKGFLVETGINHFQFNHSGSMMKATVKYKEKFNTP